MVGFQAYGCVTTATWLAKRRLVNQFTKGWQKRLTRFNRTRKSKNLIDGDSELTHVSESIAVTA
jgi:hypothetical protein